MTDYAMRDLTGEDKMSFSLNSHHVLDTLEDSIVVANAGGRIVYVNQALEKLLGWSARDLVGEPITILMPERFRDAHLSGFQKYLSTRRPTVIGTPMHVAARQRDGSDVDIELTLGVMSENASEPLFVATMRDLRERI
ncbi:MAG TPA: PAS domain S-box protein, partial [Chloroflexota bacterium]